MTIGKIIGRVSFLLNQGVLTDDSLISNRLIYDKLKCNRSMIVKQMLNQKQGISNSYYQTLRDVKLEPSSFNGMQILCSEYEMPHICNSNFGEAIQFVHIGGLKVDIVSPNRAKYVVRGNKYSGNRVCCFINDYKIYVCNNIIAKSLDINAIFEDVIEVYKHNDKEIYDYLDLDFHINDALADSLVRLSIQDLYAGQPQQQQQQEAEEPRQE